jgi:hypothetical protein
MRRRHIASVCLVFGVALWFRTGDLIGQSQTAPKPKDSAAKKWTPPRTADGRPDLQGVWSYATITPLERPDDLAGKEYLTAEEAAAYQKKLLELGNKDARPGDPLSDVSAAYNDFWWDRGTNLVGTRRTSLIVDPPDGKIPALTAEARQRAAARTEARRQRGPADGPEDRNMAERCLVSLNAGPPMIPSAYNNNIQLFQARDTVAITNEMIHNYRVVPLDGRPSIAANVQQWMGDSRGRWDGDTLVIETTNFRRDSAFRGASETLRVTERFTRVGENTLMYEFTLNDPNTWTRPWSGQIPMTKINEHIYEYACHEGNHAMFNMLSGARADDRKSQK